MKLATTVAATPLPLWRVSIWDDGAIHLAAAAEGWWQPGIAVEEVEVTDGKTDRFTRVVLHAIDEVSALDCALRLKRRLEQQKAPRDALADEIVREAEAGEEDAAKAKADRCPGHPAGLFDPMGVSVYCDGSCTPDDAEAKSDQGTGS